MLSHKSRPSGWIGLFDFPLLVRLLYDSPVHLRTWATTNSPMQVPGTVSKQVRCTKARDGERAGLL